MAIRYRYDLYPRTDPRDGTRLVRFTKLQQASYRDVVGVGSGALTIRSTDPESDYLDPDGEQYVRVVREDTGDASEVVVGGWWINKYSHKTADRNLTKRLVASGAGTMAYLARARMAPHTYIHDVFTGQDPYDDIWRLYAQSTFYANGNLLGAMLWRVIYEAQHFRSGATYTHRHKDGVTYTDSHADDRTATAIPDVVMDFDQFVDSNGNDWTIPSGEFTAQVGESVLSVVQRLMNAGLYVRMDPDTFVLSAYENEEQRRDRTGGAWGASVVRFQSPTDGTVDTGNILNESERLLESSVKRSLMWAGGGDVYSKATQASDVPWEGFESSDVADTAALSQIASRQITARNESGDTPKIRIKMGRSPTTGRYLPWEEVRIEDLVTVHTGAGEWDYSEDTYPVAALRVELQRSGAWHGWVELGDSFGSAQSKIFSTATVGAHTHPPNPELCRIGFLAEFEDQGLVGAACDNGGTNPLSDFPAWAGDREERVEITAAIAVPVGGSMIAVTGLQQQNWGAEADTVYDERGNTWTKDAEHETTASSSDDTVQIWRCNVTTAIQVGDWIRWALNVGASLSSSAEAGGRCIGVRAYSGTLTVATVGTGAGLFTGAPSISTPAGDLVVAGICFSPPSVTVDPDWSAMVPYTSVSGSGDLASGVLAQQLIPGAATTYTPVPSANADYAAIAVAYNTETESVSGDLPLPTVHTDQQSTGTSIRAARCDHEHEHGLLSDAQTHYHEADQIDGLDPFVLSDDTPLVESGSGSAGTSDEASRSDHVHPADGGGGGGGSGVVISHIPILSPSTRAEPTFDVNTTTYADLWYHSFVTDFDVVPWTHFMIWGFGRANAAATIFFRAAHSGTAALSANADDQSVGAANASLVTAWIPITASLTGIQRLSVLLRGSTATVDFTYQKLGISLKYDPPS